MSGARPEWVETPVDGLRIRFAIPGDADLILDFIRNLAAYERLTHELKVTERDVHDALFGPQPVAETILAFLGEEAVGFALFFQNFSTFRGRAGLYLEDLFVVPAARGLGVGKTLLAFLARTARERGCARMEWSVLDWNTPAMEFYRTLGAESMDDWVGFRLAEEDLEALARSFPSSGS
jgi:GNAT superfamily N-acetyltransferase